MRLFDRPRNFPWRARSRRKLSSAASLLLLLPFGRRREPVGEGRGFRTIFDLALNGQIITDSARKVRFANVSAGRIFACPPETLVGRVVSSLIAPTSQADLDGAFVSADLNPTFPPPIEVEGLTPDGFPIRMRVGRIVESPVAGYGMIIGDLRERTALVHALTERAAQLARSNHELEEYAYVASHDLQEPLRMVSSYAQLISRRYSGRLDKDADEFLGYAVDGAKRMQRLVDDLLSFSRVGTRGEPFRQVSLEVVLGQALDDLSVTLAESGGVVTHDPLPEVRADAPQVRQLLQNLIGNALKFRGAEPPQIHIGARRGPDGITISVHDNGIGIAPEYQEKIFVMFQKLHPRDRYPGTGIGLAICKKIVERHGGRIWVESMGQAGDGSTFFFTLSPNPVPPPLRAFPSVAPGPTRAEVEADLAAESLIQRRLRELV
jgi:chemotaxis family two-component system sensor kinase Cph1